MNSPVSRSGAASPGFYIIGRIALFLALIVILTIQPVYAGSATWNLDPTSGDWNTAANWTPATVPNGPADIATFDQSNTPDLVTPVDIQLNSMVFDPAASGFTITAALNSRITFSGAGIINNSGVAQNFMTLPADNFLISEIVFRRSATAGIQTVFTNAPNEGSGSGTVTF